MKSGRKEGAHEKVDKGAGAVQYAGGTERGAALLGRYSAVGGICLPNAGFRSAAGGARGVPAQLCMVLLGDGSDPGSFTWPG